MSEPLGAGLEEAADRHGAFPRLDDEQLETLRRLGTQREVKAGEILFQEGDAGYDFFVIEEGAVVIVQGYGQQNRLIAVHGRRRFLGELNLISGQTVSLTAVVRDPGRVVQVPAERLREIVAQDQELSNLILRAYVERRSILIGLGAGLRLIGSRFSPTAGAFASSSPATGCPTGGWTSRKTATLRPC